MHLLVKLEKRKKNFASLDLLDEKLDVAILLGSANSDERKDNQPREENCSQQNIA